ncbi:MAG: hypothetical protein WCP35_21260 [Verrucomicrobiota bacterium]
MLSHFPNKAPRNSGGFLLKGLRGAGRLDVFHGLLEEDRCTDRPSPTSSSVVGNAFLLNEGILKILYSAALGTGLFAKIGISYSDFLVPSVDTVETVCGLLLIFGLLRAAVRMAHETGGLKSAWQKRGAGACWVWRLC